MYCIFYYIFSTILHSFFRTNSTKAAKHEEFLIITIISRVNVIELASKTNSEASTRTSSIIVDWRSGISHLIISSFSSIRHCNCLSVVIVIREDVWHRPCERTEAWTNHPTARPRSTHRRNGWAQCDGHASSQDESCGKCFKRCCQISCKEHTKQSKNDDEFAAQQICYATSSKKSLQELTNLARHMMICWTCLSSQHHPSTHMSTSSLWNASNKQIVLVVDSITTHVHLWELTLDNC